jgi:hypothetical protein
MCFVPQKTYYDAFLETADGFLNVEEGNRHRLRLDRAA